MAESMSSIERALHALCVIGSDGKDSGVAAWGSQMLLKQPEGFSLKNASEASNEMIFIFSSSEESLAFQESVMKKGWNASLEMKSKENPSFQIYVNGSLEGNRHHRQEEKREGKQCVAYMMKSLYIPKKSFQIPKHDMHLCDSALASVQEVKNLPDAFRFLETYGSHVSQSVYHLGGVLFEVITVSCAEATSLSDLLHEGARAMKVSVTASSSSESTRTSNMACNFKQSAKGIQALGPTNVRDEKDFRSKLEEGPSSWSIINKGVDRVEDLVPVWNILLQHLQYAETDHAQERLERAAMLLYKAWLNKARSSRRLPHQLITALIECEERTYYRFQDQLQLYQDDEPEEVSSLAEALTWVSPAVELPQKLQTVLADQSSLDLSPKVSYFLRSCIAHLSSTPGGENHLRKIVIVINRYGYDENGNAEFFMYAQHLRSMIEDLSELNRVEEKRSDPQLPADLNWENTSFCLTVDQIPAEYRYIGAVLVDKPLMVQKQGRGQIQSAHVRQLILMDRLRHSLDPFQRSSLEGKPKWNRISGRANKLAGAEQDAGSCVFEDLLQIMRGSDLPAQVGIYRFLLQQRAATPLIAAMQAQSLAPTGRNELSSSFTHWVQALSFVEVKLPEEKCCYVAEDVALPRVVFLSDLGVQKSRAARVASRILSCNFPSQHMNRQRLTMSTPVVEVGVGFLDSKPCLALHVEGPYHQLMDFVVAAADVIVLEQVEDPGLNLNYEGKRMLRWNMDANDGYAEERNEIWGTEGYLVEMIGDYLISEMMDDEVQDARSANLKELCILHFHPNKLISFQYMHKILEECDFTKVRDSLCLQDSFAREACSFFALLRLKNNPGERCLMEKACDYEKKFRFQQSSFVVKNPLLQVFHRVLCQKDATERWVGLMWLQRYIFENTLGAKKDLGVVNLWRELCHTFVASPGSQRDLAKLAAQHLLDGFPLEILDGDASMFCQPWVDTVLSELEVLTTNALKRPARLFVLSAMGLQSSGKSTVLNLMFGAQLMASAGRCTRGVFMQLVPSKRPEYDYVVLLDTEGLRSPDFYGSEMGEVRDNRLAAFGLLPADASIFMISNEDDNGLKEVLPMVLLGFKGSVIAEESGGKIRAKMFFVYRSVDINDKEKLNANKAKLWKHLADASKEVASMGCSSGAFDDEWLLQNMFQDLHVDEDEQKSDVRCMGNLKKGSKPPEDVPDWEYGKQVMGLREHISRRVLDGGQWNPVGIREWRENLARVWTCIWKADFELSFKTAVECSSYAELQERLTSGPRRMVNTQFMEEFEKLEKKLREFANTELENHVGKPTVSDLFTALQNGVQSVVISQTKFVEYEILGKRRWSKWKQQEESNWNMFCKNLEESYKSRIKDMCDGVFEYDAAARRYEMQMKKEIVAIFQNKDLPMSNDKFISREQKKMARDTHFNGVFQRILSEAEQSHPPLAQDVRRKVAEAYERTRIAAEVDLWASPHKLFQVIGNKASSLIKGRVKPQELQKKLRDCIDFSLKDARQYSEVVAESVVIETNKMINNAGCSRDLREQFHAYVKGELTAAFEKIQTLWDDEHNISAKLRGAESRLGAFFENCADGIGAANMLISELEHLLRDELVVRHHDGLVCFLSDSLSSNALMRDWKKLRACLDLHLLTLISNKSSSNTEQLLRFVADGSEHYKAVTDVLIREQIEKCYNKQQRRYMGIVLRSLEDAADSVTDAQAHHPATVEFFLGTLKQIMEGSLENYEKNLSCLPLGQFLYSTVSRDAYEGGSSTLDSHFYKTGVKELCQRLMSLQCGLVEASKECGLMQTLINGVRKRMQIGNDDLGPRCTEQCPMCGILCIKAAGHTSKHDTVHQVCGLGGGNHFSTLELWKWSCYEDIVQKNRFQHQDVWYPAKDFEKVFPDWVNPCALSADAARSLQVREYIFYNYQNDLIKKYIGKKRCSDIPNSYNHDLQMLQNQVRNMLQDDYPELKKMFTQQLIGRP